jgi:hypothetical protein
MPRSEWILMQNNIEMKHTAVSPRQIEPKTLNILSRKTAGAHQLLASGFTREEMRQIVAEQID